MNNVLNSLHRPTHLLPLLPAEPFSRPHGWLATVSLLLA